MFVEEQPQKKKILCELACDSVIEDTRLQLSRPYIKPVKLFLHLCKMPAPNLHKGGGRRLWSLLS